MAAHLKSLKFTMSFIVAALMVWKSVSYADCTDAISKSPAEVQATVKKVLGDKIAMGFDPGDAPDQVTYALSYDDNFIGHVAYIAQDGSIIEQDIALSSDKLPATVSAAANKAYPQGTIDYAYTAAAGDKSYFRVGVTDGKNDRELKIDSNGTVLADVVEATEIEPGSLPAAIADAAKTAHPGGSVVYAARMRGNNKTIYVLTIQVDKNSFTTEINADGTVYTDMPGSIDADIASLPAAVTDAIKKAYDGTTIQTAYTINSNGETIYDVDVTVGNGDHQRSRELKVTSAGTIVSDMAIAIPTTQP